MRLLSTAVSVLVVFLLPPQGARADECRDVDTTIVTTFFVTGCRSPVGICTKGEVPTGPLAGKTRFRALSVTPGAAPDILVYTGELVIKTKSGKVRIRDRGFVNGTTAQYFELDQVVGGTGKYKGATGLLTSQGLMTATGFRGTLTGTICLAKHKDRHHEDDGDHDDSGDDEE